MRRSLWPSEKKPEAKRTNRTSKTGLLCDSSLTPDPACRSVYRPRTVPQADKDEEATTSKKGAKAANEKPKKRAQAALKENSAPKRARKKKVQSDEEDGASEQSDDDDGEAGKPDDDESQPTKGKVRQSQAGAKSGKPATKVSARVWVGVGRGAGGASGSA